MTTDHALYNIKRGPHGYAIGKFDRDLNLLAAYNTSTDYCSCPAGPRPTCRHRKMLPRMLAKVDQPEFYCYETQTWHRPFEMDSLAMGGLADEINELAAAGGNKVVQEQGGAVTGRFETDGKHIEEVGPVWNVGCGTGVMQITAPASPAPSPTIRRR